MGNINDYGNNRKNVTYKICHIKVTHLFVGEEKSWVEQDLTELDLQIHTTP